MIALLAGFALAGVIGLAWTAPASAQGFTYNPRPPKPPPRPANNNGQMLVQAVEVDYDYNNQRVSAVGNVQMFYNGTSVEADKVIYDQKTKRLHAEGNIRLTDAEGKITYANIMDLSDDYRDGFVDSLRVDTEDATRMAATRADRTSGNYTVFENGVYTACAPCKDDPKKPPLWQVKGARIIHDQTEKMLYFENAQLEFFGVPMAYLPYFSTPDPTVKRKTGFLMPFLSSYTPYGYGVETPFYWAIAPDYDATFNPRITTRQGVLFQGEFRQRLINGSYQIRAYGINQLDPQRLHRPARRPRFPRRRRNQGPVRAQRQMDLGLGRRAAVRLLLHVRLPAGPVQGYAGIVPEPADRSDLAALSDRRRQSQLLRRAHDLLPQLLRQPGEGSGHPSGDRLFQRDQQPDLRRRGQLQDQLHQPVALDRGVRPDHDAGQHQRPLHHRVRRSAGADTVAVPAARHARHLHARSPRKRSGGGRSPTPTVKSGRRSRSPAPTPIDASISNQPGVSNFLPVGDTTALRVMPTVGLEYRYPFINVQPWGTTTIEPIAQVIIRPNETYAGRLPNEDAQSMVFDASNLFAVDKFSGYDRIEGGGRANVGVQATTQFDRGGSINVLFGQSYQLFGMNSFAVADLTNTGVDSGLQNTRSDYVARVNYSPNRTYTFSVRSRMDEATLNVNRFEAEGRATFDRWSVSLLYGNYAEQPDLGYLTRREGLLGSASVKLATNWVVSGSARWDLEANKLNQYIIGAGYVDDCFVLAANYVTSYSYSAGTTPPVLSHAFMLQIGLRTIANSSTSATGAGGLQ